MNRAHTKRYGQSLFHTYRVEGQPILVKLKTCILNSSKCQIAMKRMETLPWWPSGGSWCWPLWRGPDPSRHCLSTKIFHKTYFRNYRKPVVYNNLDEEHDLARGIGGADNPLRVKASVEAPRPLVSFGPLNQAIVQLAQVKQGQTRSNMAKQGQT